MFKVKSNWVLSFWGIFVSANMLAQNQVNKAAEVTLPSPTSASLGNYGNIPVSLYNGTPEIGIPLYQIKTNNHSVNLRLQYNATGTKVSEDASLAGLGWSLSTGGAVTRIVRQKDDLNTNYGYYYVASLPASNTDNSYHYTSENQWLIDLQYGNDINSGITDAEPDIFSYNFCGYSGRFVIGKNASGSSIFLDEKNNMEIKYLSGGWIFTDPLGYKFYLKTTEIAQNYYRSSQTELTTLSGVNGLNFDINPSPITAWYIDSIVAPTNEKIAFTYSKGKSLSLFNKSEQLFKMTSLEILPSVNCTSSLPSLPDDYHSYDITRQELTDVYLKKIEFVNGYIEFKHSARADIDNLTIPEGFMAPSKLDSVIIRNANGEFIKGFILYYSYFNASNTSGRLKLDSISEIGKGNVKNSPYTFSYYNQNSLPGKYDKNIDHWGFYNYNGAINYTLLPTTVFPSAVGSFSGADREANETNNYPINGVLKEIKYPTGGKTVFEYELHEYANLQGEQAYRVVNKFAMARSNPDIYPADDEKEIEFTIPPLPGSVNGKVPVTIWCNYSKVNPNLDDLVSFGYSNMWKQNSSGVWQSIAGCQTSNYDGQNASPIERMDNFDPGNYRILVQSTSGWSFAMSISWIEKEPVTSRKGGGIRIKKITDEDNLGNTSVKRYLYQLNDSAATSSGKLLSNPQYAYALSVGLNNARIGTGFYESCNYASGFHTILSGSIYNSGLSSRSGIVGYSKVTELIGENGENGRTEYYYHNAHESTPSFPFIPSKADPQNGKADSVKTYTAGGVLIKKNEFNYQLKETNSLKGLKLLSINVFDGGFCGQFYDNFSHWVVLKQETETLYTSSGAIATTKEYYYNNNKHLELTQVDITKSDGTTLITKYKRPDDYTVSGGNSFVEQMRDIHIISPIIEQQTFLKQGTTTKLLSGTFAKFARFNNQFYKPSIIYDIEATSPLSDLTESSFASNGQPVMHPAYTPALYFYKYSALGNILEQQKANDVKESYIWGYNSQYPIASATNAAVKDIFHTSFEEGDDIGVQQTYNPNTGERFKLLSSAGYSKSLTNLTPGQYILSYWQLISGSRWEYHQSVVTVTGTTYNINIAYNNGIDELRFYPVGTQMTTYTYNPLVGMTSQCDANSQIISYEYDSFGRLYCVRDQDRNVLKRYTYNYQGQTEYGSVLPIDDGTTPLKITDFGIAYGNSKVTLTWTNRAYNAQRIDVYRATSIMGPYTLLTPNGTGSSSDTSYIDATATQPGTKYYYVVRTSNQYGGNNSATQMISIP